MANTACNKEINAPANGAATSPQIELLVKLATIPDTKAAASNCPSMAILITPDFSQSKPDIEPKIKGTESMSAPCNKPVNGMNLPLAAQQRNAIVKLKPKIKLERLRVRFDLSCKYPTNTPITDNRRNIPAPVFEAITHSFISFHSSPTINPNVIGSVFSELK